MQSHARLSETLAAIPRMFKSISDFRRRSGEFQHSRLAGGTAPLAGSAGPAAGQGIGRASRRPTWQRSADTRSRDARLRESHRTARRRRTAGECKWQLHHRGDALAFRGHDRERRGCEGRSHNFTMNSADSRIYPGSWTARRATGTSRQPRENERPERSGAIHAPRGRLRPGRVTRPGRSRRSSSVPMGPIRCCSTPSTT